MPRIFICYRRDDTAGHTGRLRDALSAEFGADEIFRDLDTIGPGDDFVQAMSSGVASCSVFLAVVGRQWLALTDRNGRRRLDDPADHVRTELAEALERGVRVIPALVQGASMPGAADLPDALKAFASRNAIALDDDSWQSDVNRLVQAIRRELHLSPAPARVGDAARPGRRRAVLGVVAAAVVVAAILAFNRTRSSESSQNGPAAPPAASSGSSAERSSAKVGSGPAVQATLPAGGEAGVGQLVYEVVDAAVSSGPDGRVLNLRIRLTNHQGYNVMFSDAEFRLQVDGEQRPPTSGLSDLVAGESAKENTVTFPLPPAVATATLRVTSLGETADIPLDLNGRSGPTAAQDRELRRSGKRTFAVPLDPATARMRLGDVICELRSASLHRYSHKLTLTVDIRAENRGRYPIDFGDSHFRLVLDGAARPPVSGLSTSVAAEGSRDGAIVFDLPLDATEVVLRARFGDVSAEIPLHLPQSS